VLLPAVAISVASAIVFLLWRDVPGLVLARIINGLSVGVVAATATAWLTELHTQAHPPGPEGSAMRAQLIATGVNLGGLGLGPLVSGALAQWAGSPLTVPYIVLLVALVVAVAVVALTPETRERLDPLPTYRVQRVSVPEAARGQFFNAAWGAFVAFGALGLFTGLSATFLVGTLHETSHLLAGVTVFALFAAGVVAQVSLATAPPRRLLTTGSVLMVVGLVLTALAVWLPSPSYALFLVGGALTGGGAGAVFKGSVGTVIAITEPHQRAEALAGIFLAGYVGLSVPVVGAGVALQFASPRDTLLGFAIIEVVAIAAIARRMLAGGDRDAAARQDLVTA
jgi:MFS family permease